MADSSVPITAGAGTPVDTRTAGNGDHRQVMVPGGDGDYVGGVTPYGYLRVNSDATGLFYDAFNGTVLDTTDRWTLTGPTPAMPSGWMQPSTTVSTNTSLQSKPVMVVQTSAYLNQSAVVQLETATATGAGRFWGLGVPAAAPSSTALVTDGAGWEVQASDGALLAVTYAGGVRTVQATIIAGAALGSGTIPNFRDGNFHRYSMIFRQSRIYWYVDGFDAHVASVAYPSLGSTQDLPILSVRNNAASYTGTPVFNIMAIGCGDMSRNGVQLSDGAMPWRKARVDATGNLSVNLGSSGGLSQVPGTISAAAVNNPGVASTTSSTSQVVANVAAAGNVTFHLVSATFVGTVVFEASVDGGLNYGPIFAMREDGTGAENGTTIPTGAFIRQYTAGMPGMTWFRVRASAVTSGTLAVVIAPGPFLIEPTPSLGSSTAVIGTVRNIIDNQNRTIFIAQATNIALTATETLTTLTPYRAGVAGTGASALAVTAGKTLRMQSMSLTLVGAATAAATAATVRLRYVATGTVVASSPIVEQISVNLAAIASYRGGQNVSFNADGFEIPAGASFGISVVGIASGTVDVQLKGYEYT